jgi:hypothetical protein
MATSTDFQPVFNQLKSILAPYAPNLKTTADTDNDYNLYTSHVMYNKQDLYFAGLRKQKNYVSFYLMPVYIFPELLADISPELKKRMQGKSCFNFKKVDDQLFQELAQLTQAGYQRYPAEGYV